MIDVKFLASEIANQFSGSKIEYDRYDGFRILIPYDVPIMAGRNKVFSFDLRVDVNISEREANIDRGSGKIALYAGTVFEFNLLNAENFDQKLLDDLCKARSIQNQSQ